ncbi:small acid-soluble spore protein SspI [Paenibacillus segetis]|uniref:Small, acid-soluble spore protein I n=1 Tax=Paenibacillus segetis TaxID=1325360 RepID=A0ABQ1YQH8_9BACL|nr:small acid-soluble spore protein SspI [Paenibacillus segetis]GGH34887.1 small, acid-soluble spore protein I [Paenibacillus segetis]
MPLTLNLRQAVMHKIHGKNEEDLRSMIEGSIDAQEAALPGLGVMFEIMWKNMDQAKQDALISMLHNKSEATDLGQVK